MSNTISVGLAGAGWPTWQHIKGYRKVENVEVSALCDSDPERLERIADEYGVPGRYVSFDEMVDQESLDAVSVCTPNYLHSVMAIRALEKGLVSSDDETLVGLLHSMERGIEQMASVTDILRRLAAPDGTDADREELQERFQKLKSKYAT